MTRLEQFIKKRPPIRLVAGGIIFNETLTELLIVKGGKSHKWGLAKGGIKEGESYIEASLREIHEETGLEIKLLADVLPFVCIGQAKLYIYVLPKAMCQLKPMDENEIIDIRWINLHSLARLEGMTKLLSIITHRIWEYVAKVKQYKRIYQPIIIGNGENQHVEYDPFSRETSSFRKSEISRDNTFVLKPVLQAKFVLNKYLADKITLYAESSYSLNEIVRKITDEFPKLLNTGDICLTATKLLASSMQKVQSWRRSGDTSFPRNSLSPNKWGNIGDNPSNNNHNHNNNDHNQTCNNQKQNDPIYDITNLTTAISA